ncbi:MULTISPECIES: 3-keto-5-aminohexanoate cleavage protein [unclassified Bradyrhizobium]|uniref:3-keto-5-aminohexanoate cleavage protein n=1 Tax=unclassified Bradyrhizobium TaxID=2631580 RepID=UPI001FF9934E|nr:MULTISPECIES: 3-keto-5-aminohexanoate cleavage protein [unclassified Bradyrhizobium]
MLAQAFLLGGHVRVGMEDNLYMSKSVLLYVQERVGDDQCGTRRACRGAPQEPRCHRRDRRGRAILGLA